MVWTGGYKNFIASVADTDAGLEITKSEVIILASKIIKRRKFQNFDILRLSSLRYPKIPNPSTKTRDSLHW